MSTPPADAPDAAAEPAAGPTAGGEEAGGGPAGGEEAGATSAGSGPPVGERTAGASRTWVDLALVGWLTLIGAAVAVVCFFFLPLYLGAVPFPISSLVAAAACWYLPRLAYRLTGSLVLAAAPVVAWFLITVVLFLVPNPTYSSPRIHSGEWRLMLLLGFGALAGAASLGILWGEALRASLSVESSSAASTGSSVGTAIPGRSRSSGETSPPRGQ